MGEELQKEITASLVLVGVIALVVGCVLAFSGVNIPVGIALIGIGAAALIAAAALNWNTMGEELQTIITGVLTLVGVAALVIGCVLTFSGVNLPIGIALIALGAASLISTVALNWNTIGETTREKIMQIIGIVSYGMLALGVILLFTCPPLWGVALGMIGAGASILAVTRQTPNWNTLKNKFVEMWNNIGSWWRNGPSKYLTIEYWRSKAADMINGLVNGIRSGISRVGSAISSLFSGSNADISINTSSAPAVTRSAASASASTYPASITRAQVPALARGAVIPANREFLAVLGDQKHGRNLEAPEGLIREIVGEGNQQIVVLLTELLAAVRAGKNVYLDGQKISDNTVRHINGSIARTGTIPLNI